MTWKGRISEFEMDLPVDAPRVTLLAGNTSASLAGVLKLHKRGFFRGGDQVACVLTGTGLKDPDCAMRGITTGFAEGGQGYRGQAQQCRMERKIW